MAKLTRSRLLEELSPDAIGYFFPGYEAEEHEFLSSYCEDIAFADEEAGLIADIEVSLGDVESADDLAVEDAAAAEEEEERRQALLREIEAIQNKYGVSIDEIEAVLRYKVKLSHLRVTRRHELILEDFDRREVRMDTLTKAVYLLFLKHPEGIRYKDLSDYRDELEAIYTSISGRTDMDAIRRSIDGLTDPITNNSINEKVSKAKKAFLNIVNERVATFYYIDGKQGAAKKIALDRSLVIWE